MQRIVIVGGTHGNEWGGIYLCKKLEKNVPLKYPFKIETYLANPGAIARNSRYLEEDLNRQFCSEDLLNHDLTSYEAQRAKVIAQDLAGTDWLIDLHNTTSNMGLTLILSRQDALEDVLTRQLCAHLTNIEPRVKIFTTPIPQENNPYLPSLAQRDLTLEVGPQAHGTLRADLFAKTETLLYACLQYLADWQKGQAKEYKGELEVYEFRQNLDYPRGQDASLAGMIHPDLLGRDFKPLRPGDPLFVTFSGQVSYFQGPEIVWPVFINEQAYFEKHMAMSLTQKIQVVL